MKTGEADAGLGKACLAAAGEASPPRVKSVAPRVLDVVSYNATISSCQSGPWKPGWRSVNEREVVRCGVLERVL